MPNAIISVYDKTNLPYLGQLLLKFGFHIYATPGTRSYLLEQGIAASPIEQIAQNPQGFDDFVSSLSFKTMIGTVAEDPGFLEKQSICPIDLVVYNFVPTWDIIHSPEDFNIRHVDLGGPTIVKAAAINYKRALPMISPRQYRLLEQYPNITASARIALAREALEYCADYDRKLSHWLQKFES